MLIIGRLVAMSFSRSGHAGCGRAALVELAPLRRWNPLSFRTVLPSLDGCAFAAPSLPPSMSLSVPGLFLMLVAVLAGCAPLSPTEPGAPSQTAATAQPVPSWRAAEALVEVGARPSSVTASDLDYRLDGSDVLRPRLAARCAEAAGVPLAMPSSANWSRIYTRTGSIQARPARR